VSERPRVDRQPSTATLGPGLFRIVHSDGTQTLAYGVADGTRVWVFLDGQTYVVDAEATHTRASHADDPTALSAPMPASVAQLNVSPGQRVLKGETMIVLEAMKMELPIHAPRDGVVARVNCRVGELVQPGVPLAELEPEHQPGIGHGEA
jgi:3-methylcrotonyl-CoA carboxylase alpha subunit